MTAASPFSPSPVHGQAHVRPASVPAYPLTLVRLRWALTFAALRTSVLQKVGFVLGILAALAAVVGCAAFGTMIGRDSARMVGNLHGSQIMAGLSVYIGTLIAAIAFVSQLSVFGDSAGFSQRRMGLFGLPEPQLLAGLLLSQFAGIPEITAVIALTALWVTGSPSVGSPFFVILALPAAIVVVAVWVSLSRVLLSVAELIARSKAGMTVITIVFILCCLALYMWSVPATSSPDNNETIVLDMRVVGVLSWLPLGAALQLPFNLAAGAWAGTLGRVAVIAASLALCWQISLVSLRHQRFQVHQKEKEQKVEGLGVFARVPDTPRGAVLGRVLVAWRRDPRYLSTLILPVILCVFTGIEAWQGEEMMSLWVAPVLVALFLPANEANAFAFDGPALATEIESGVPGRDDRAGRVLASLGVGLVLTLLSVAVAWGLNAHGDSDSREGMMIQLLLAVGCVAILLVGYGTAAVFAPVLPYPVASRDNPMRSARGRTGAQIGIPFLEFAVQIACLLPTGIVAGVLMGSGQLLRLWWAAVAVGLANGIGVLAGGIILGGHLYDRHALRLLQKIQGFAAIEQ